MRTTTQPPHPPSLDVRRPRFDAGGEDSEFRGAPPGHPSSGRPPLGFALSAAGVTLAAVVGQAPGFLIPIAIAWTLGAGPATDALFLAFALATFVASPLIAAAQDVALPFLVSNRERGGDRAQYLGQTAAAVLLFAVGLSALLVLVGPAILAFGVGTPGNGPHPAAALLWVFAPYIVASSVAALGVGALNAERAYVRAALSPVLRSMIVLAALLLLSPFMGVTAVAYGYVAGEICRVWYLHRALRGVYGKAVRILKPPRELLEFCRKAGAQVAGSAALAMLPLIDRFWAGRLGPGSVSILDYAERLWQVPLSFLMSGVLIVVLSRWSTDLYSRNETHTLAANTRRTAVLLSAMSLPLCLLVLAFRYPLVGVLFSSGTIPAPQLATLADTFGAFVAGLPIYVAGLVYAKAFLVLRRSDWLLAIAVVQVFAKLLLNGLFLPWWGLPGIALATAVTFGLSSLALIVVFPVVVRQFQPRRDGNSTR